MENFANRLQFKFYKSYFDIALEIEDLNERANYLMAICQYQFTGVEPELTGMTKFAFLSQKHSLDKQVKGYNDAINSLKNQKPTPQPQHTTPQGGAIPIPATQPQETIINKQYTITTEEEKFIAVVEYPDIDFGDLKTPTQLNNEFKNEYRDNQIHSMAPLISISDFKTEYLTDHLAIKAMDKLFKLNPDKVILALEEYVNTAISNGDNVIQTYNRYKKHFTNWVRKKIQITNQ